MTERIEISETTPDGLSGKYRMFECYRDGELVGDARVDEERNGNNVAIQSIGVKSEHMGEGVGSLIVESICDFYSSDHDEVYAGDVLSPGFFSKIGFERCESKFAESWYRREL